MTTREDHAAPVTGSVFRPGWLTEPVLDDLRARVCSGAGEPTPDVVALAPYDLLPTAPVPSSSVLDVTEAVSRGRVAQRSWAALPLARRCQVVLAFHDLLVERQDQVLDLIQWETGKSRFHAWQEIAQVATIARHYARRARRHLADNRVRGMVPLLTKVTEVRVPKGVVGIISPWNYPLYLGVGDVLPALLAGNAVVSKADPQTSLTMLWTHALLAEAGLPADVWQIVVGEGVPVGTALVDEADFVCFTGSTATGRIVAEQAGRRLVGASLELGGKNPLIVRADADVDKAVAGAVAAAYANTGQMCISIERIYVHESVYESFRDGFVAATAEQRIGQALDFSVELGPLISQRQLDAVTAHVEDAVAHGATVLTGGRARPDLGPLCFEPTVLEGVTPEMRVYAEETFGPVVELYPFRTDEEAIALANEGCYGLSASIWSRDTHEAARMAPQIRAGSVNINDGAAAAAGSIEAGMGGMGESGLGRRHGAEGIRKFTESQTVAIQRLIPLGAAPGKTESFVESTNKQLTLMRKIGVR
ncbi:succinic semialdehyde dehydrogenase [Nocardioides sp. NPDC057577]|uniref:succinic semialdehyde dehydrogenase n=1 Tax=Nocardioides sp. NPDC057577 TaxID=3346171 RepID=UPI00367085B0